jgi:hypothetical protein
LTSATIANAIETAAVCDDDNRELSGLPISGLLTFGPSQVPASGARQRPAGNEKA